MSFSAFLDYEKIQKIRLKKSSPENICLKPCSASFFQSTDCLISDLYPELLLQLKVNSELILVGVDGK